MIKVDVNKIFEKSNLYFLKNNTIFLTIYGSHAYGMAREYSDIDVRGICTVPKKYIYGLLDTFEQAIFNEPYDTTIFSLKKFVNLSTNMNPNAVELLFTNPSDHLFISNIGQDLLNIRELFLSKKARWTLGSYAKAQIKRINVHRSWLLRKDTIKKPERENFGLNNVEKQIPGEQILEIEAAVRKKLEEWIIDTTGMEIDVALKFKDELEEVLIDLKLNTEEFENYALRSLGLDDNLTAAFQKERAYRTAKREWKQFNEWKENRNKERFILEEKHMMDTKHASHVVRLYRECIELLETGKLNVKRPDFQELLFIRDGGWDYDKLMQFSKDSDEKLDSLYITSSLQKEPDRIKINEWYINTVEKYLENSK